MHFVFLKFIFLIVFWLTAGLIHASDKGYAVAGSFKSLPNARNMALSIQGWLKNSGIPGDVSIEESRGKATIWHRVLILPGDGISARSVISLLKQGGYAGAWFLPSGQLAVELEQSAGAFFLGRSSEERSIE